MYTLSIIFNKSMDAVLVSMNKDKKYMMSFISGKVRTMEDNLEASYRELEENTGITKDDVELKFLQTETSVMADNSNWSLYITYGVLNKDVILRVENNPLTWVHDFELMKMCGCDGDCAVYLNRALRLISESNKS